MTDCACIYNAPRKLSLPLFHRRLNELPCCLSFPFLLLLLLFTILFWSQSSDVRKSYGEERHADHKCRKIGDIQTTLCPVTCLCRWIRGSSVRFCVSVKMHRQDLSLLDADFFCFPDCPGRQRKHWNHMHNIPKLTFLQRCLIHISLSNFSVNWNTQCCYAEARIPSVPLQQHRHGNSASF